MGDQENFDAYERARRASEIADDADDQARRAAEDDATAAAAAATEKQRLAALEQAAAGLRKGDPYKPLIRKAIEQGLCAGNVAHVLKVIGAATGVSLQDLRSDASNIRAEINAERKRERSQKAGRTRRQAEKKIFADPAYEELARQYPAPEGLSYGYHPTTNGLMLGTTSDLDGEFVPRCTPFTITASITFHEEDDEGVEHTSKGLLVAVRDKNGKRNVVQLRSADFGSSYGIGKAREQMTDVGLVIFGDDGRKAVGDIIAGALPPEEINVFSRPSYHELDDAKFYITIDGRPLGDLAGLNVTLKSSVRLPPKIALGGDMQGWRDVVNKVVALDGVPHWRFGLIAGFAGPLIDLLGLDTVGINLQGATSLGKTIALTLAVSAWSHPSRSRGLLNRGSYTISKIEVLAARATGAILAIDELAKITGMELHELVFRLAGNAGRGRLDRNGEERPTLDWRVFVLFSSEMAIEDKIRSDKRVKLTGGLSMRVVELPIDEDHVVRLPDPVVKDIVRRACNHYGHAGPVFAERLLREDRDLLRDLIDKATLALTREDGHAIEMRMQQMFAVLKVAGELAIGYGLLPSEIDVDGTVRWALGRVLEENESLLTPIDNAEEEVRLWIAQRIGYSVILCTAMPTLRLPEAWYDDHAVYIPKNTFSGILSSERKAADIAAAFRKRGLIYTPACEAGRNTTRRIPKHGGIPAYPLDRLRLGIGETEEEAVEAVKQAMGKPAQEQRLRDKYGSERFDDLFQRAKTAADAEASETRMQEARRAAEKSGKKWPEPKNDGRWG